MTDDTVGSRVQGPPARFAISARRGLAASLVGSGFLFGLLYFVQGIGEPTEGLLSQPTKSLLRTWGHSAETAAWFASILTIPWVIKPLYGLLTDFVPLWGSRRRIYLLLTTAVAFVGMTAVYFLPLTSDRATLLLLLLLPPAVALAFSDVVIDALMIQIGQPMGMTGRFQSIQWASIYASTILTGVLGGALSQWGMQQTGFLIAGLACGASLLAVWVLVRDPPAEAETASSESQPGDGFKVGLARAWAEMRLTLREPGVLAVSAFLFLWSFNPFSSTVLYYYSTETLHFSEQLCGTLTSWSAGGALLGCILYGVFCRSIPMRWLIHASIATGVLATIAYWAYRDPLSAVIISVGVGIVGGIGTLIQLDLAARVCRPETAGTTFALLMSLTNLAVALSQGLGGSLFETMALRLGQTGAFQALVAVGALFTAACWLLMPWFNRALAAKRGSSV